MQTTGTHIGTVRLRVRETILDPLLSRLRVQSILDAAHLQPDGLAPSAILYIRRLRGPMQLKSCGTRPSQAWERAIAASLNQLSRSAARPALGAVPANAEAVLFVDRAEMLASLAKDWCDGSLIDHWWWRSLLKGADSWNIVLNAWVDAPEYVPAALEHLANSGSVVPFIRNIGSSGSRVLLRSVTDRYAMPALAAQVDDIPDFVIAPWAEVELTNRDDVSANMTEAFWLPDGLPQTAPWHRWVPECSGGGLNPLQQCLLGVGLMLARAPHVARSLSFATAVRQWSHLKQDFETTHVQATAEELAPQPEEHATCLTTTEKHLESSATAEQHSKTPATVSPDVQPNPAQLTIGESRVLPQTLVESARTGVVDRHLPKPKPGQLNDGPEECTADIIMPPLHSDHAVACQAGLADSAVLLETSIETELGGLFYLINLGLFLDLYGDFTSPLQPGIPLPIWDFVALIGRRLLGGEIEADPVWPLLSRFSDRSDSDFPGKDFKPPERWQLPAEWLSPFPEAGRWKWLAKEGRLYVRHSEGFLVLDLPLNGENPIEQVQLETEAYGQYVPFELERVAAGGDCSATAPLEQWLDRLMPYLQARFRRALGLSKARNVPHVLCRHKARVSVTAAHVDVFFALDKHPIEIRLAGLDRNPGWVPAAGRYITFHYE